MIEIVIWQSSNFVRRVLSGGKLRLESAAVEQAFAAAID
jgi:hypothetical protein